MGTVPSRKHNFSESKEPSGKKKRMPDFTKGPTMMTRSMQREKEERRRKPFNAVKSLPNLSRALIQAINLCKSTKGLSVTELKDALGARGYDVSRHCPSIKRQLKSLASRGALMRMTDKVGSSFFVIRKQPGKEVTATPASKGYENTVRTKKTGAERMNFQRGYAKMPRVAVQAKSSLLRALEASRKDWRSPDGNQKPNRAPISERQPTQLIRHSSSTKTLPRPIKRAVSTVKRPRSSATKVVPFTKRQRSSSRKPASSRKRSPRSTAANVVKRSGSPVRQDLLKRSKRFRNGVLVSAKRLRRPNSHAAFNMKALTYFRRKTPPAGKRSKRKASFLPPGPNRRIILNTKRPRRI